MPFVKHTIIPVNISTKDKNNNNSNNKAIPKIIVPFLYILQGEIFQLGSHAYLKKSMSLRTMS